MERNHSLRSEYGIMHSPRLHDPSSPYNPQSNGSSEATVEATKHLLMNVGGTPGPRDVLGYQQV